MPIIHTAGVSGINPDKGPPAKLKSAVLIIIFKIPGANVISTVDNVLAEMPHLQAAIPPTIKIDVAVDRTTTIRASVHDVEISLIISVLLVVLVVFLFPCAKCGPRSFRRWRCRFRWWAPSA